MHNNSDCIDGAAHEDDKSNAVPIFGNTEYHLQRNHNRTVKSIRLQVTAPTNCRTLPSPSVRRLFFLQVTTGESSRSGYHHFRLDSCGWSLEWTDVLSSVSHRPTIKHISGAAVAGLGCSTTRSLKVI